VSDLAAFARRRRSSEQLLADTGHGEGGDLSRSLGFTALTMLSIGAMVGTGIFFVLGTTVADAGPAVLMSFAVAGFLSILSALSYAELASAIPVSGSAYSYAYALFGHFAAWMTGVFLTMEYGLSISAVAVGWGAYINDFLASFGQALPDAIAAPPGDDAGHHRRDPGDRGRGLPGPVRVSAPQVEDRVPPPTSCRGQRRQLVGPWPEHAPQCTAAASGTPMIEYPPST
jgi:APA family basic amino acid/polyamine antiporter